MIIGRLLLAFRFYLDEKVYFLSRCEASEKDGRTGSRRVFTHLAAAENVAATQNQAMFALLFLYKEVLGVELDRLGGKFTLAKRLRRASVVVTRKEVAAVLSHLRGVNWITTESSGRD